MVPARVPLVVGLVLAVSAPISACSGPATEDQERPLRLSQPRAVHRATLLQDGRVLVTGGCTEPGCGGFEAGRRAELYDEGSGLVRGAEMACAAGQRHGHGAGRRSGADRRWLPRRRPTGDRVG